MKFKLFLISLCTIALTACTSMHQKYDNFRNAHETYHPTSNSIAPPKGVDESQVDSSYVVPPLKDADKMKQVPLAPPGSQLNQSNAPPTSTVANVKMQYSLIKKPFDTAWKEVGKAIHVSGYKILDEDNGLGTYYLLDTSTTRGKIQKNTPIYQLHLKKVKQGVELVLLNSKNQLAKPEVANKILAAVINATAKMT